MSHDVHLPKAPPPIRLGNAVYGAAALAAAAGAAAFVYGLRNGHPEAAWSGYLMGCFYALGLGVFGVLWLAILYLSKAVWSVSTRRIPEAMTAWLLPGGALALLVGLGGHSLYHWTDAAAVAGDELLRHKAPFLNQRMFYLLIAMSVVVWLLFASAMLRNSRSQDEQGKAELHHKNVVLSAAFVVLFALTFSVVSFYLLMSLEAHWFSTMFAVLTFTDVVQTGTAFVAIVTGALMLRGELRGFLNENHLHSLAKMMFAATGFWAYIYFCQYLLIWYANIPEETAYFIARTENGWLPYLLLLPVVKFVVPFIFLVPRASKRRPGRVIAAAVLLLLAQGLELYVMVAPGIGHGEHKIHGHLPVLEGLVTLGFVGLFVLVFAWAIGRRSAVPLKDPYLRECLHYHQ